MLRRRTSAVAALVCTAIASILLVTGGRAAAAPQPAESSSSRNQSQVAAAPRASIAAEQPATPAKKVVPGVGIVPGVLAELPELREPTTAYAVGAGHARTVIVYDLDGGHGRSPPR